jgi:Zn-dependent metalloprotease
MGLSKKTYQGSPEQAGRDFLADNAALFGFANIENLAHKETKRHRGIQHVTFNQTVHGVPIYEAEYQVHLRPNGKVDMANGTYYPNVEVSTSPSISKASAIQTAKSDNEWLEGADLQTNSELVIYRTEEQFHLAWKLELYSELTLVNWLYMVDAHSGEVLYKLDLTTPVTGDGDVYPTHPGISSITNKDLFRLNGSGNLNGVYVTVKNDDGSEAYSGSNSFQYNSSNTHFDEANLYYHVDDFRHNFIEQIDDGSLGFTKLEAHAHAYHNVYGDLNAWFHRPNKDIYFGDAASSGLYNDFAKEDKVIYHEYGHAVIYDIKSGITSSDDEEGGISEGLPDYWAGSFTGRAQIGNYVGFLRNMNSPYIDSYSEYQNEPNYPIVNAHRGGEFFSAILWSLRSKISTNDTDFLTYDALYRVTSDPDFMSYRNALIASDNAVYSSANYAEIQNAFADFGIGTHTPPQVSVSGPGSIPQNSSGVFTATITDNYSSGPYTYQWYYKEIIDHSWTPVGSNSNTYTYYTGSSGGAYRIKVSVTYANSSEGTAEKTFIINL